ncbi:hypothetical protein AMS68_002936 [Peltaster fructicola]|uniref:Heterokaryon incompatibility domain-containing protein n=1 Tax=Peltaster fructicola TaxID=286661 RepID=A0A6H0XS17_9PEZI|nr:hypothetical protein AMS68_002936 [Peltaster fructicola]
MPAPTDTELYEAVAGGVTKSVELGQSLTKPFAYDVIAERLEICRLCGHIDLFDVVNGPVPGFQTQTIATLNGGLAACSKSSCPQCRFLVSVLAPAQAEGVRFEGEALDNFNLCLRSFTLLRTLLRHRTGPTSSDPSTYISGYRGVGVVPSIPARTHRPFGWPDSDYSYLLSKSGYIVETLSEADESRYSVRGREIDHKVADFEVIKGWLSYCDDHHGSACSDKDIGLAPYFRLIDCRYRRVVSISDFTRYVALSYRWGLPGGEPAGDGTLPPDVPETIQDAIQVTLRIGERYLWVDRYCVYQDDAEGVKKQAQILSMDQVYRGAYATIIAVCDDPKLGLPGGGRIPRFEQPKISRGGRTLVSTLANPTAEITSSVWMTRGWTFQEGLLSSRRLFFTRQQVYFECNVDSFYETLVESQEVMDAMTSDVHDHQNDYGRRDKGNRVFPRGSLADTLAADPWEIESRLAEYLSRKLSFESDMLNAVVSVLRIFKPSQAQRAFTHLWGVPVLWKNDGSLSLQDGFITGLLWRSYNDNIHRRAGFPSWSWAGWTATSLTFMKYQGSENMLCFPETTVKVELQDGRCLTLPEYARLLSDAHGATIASLASEPALCIRLEAWAVQINLLQIEDITIRWSLAIDNGEEVYGFWIEMTTKTDLNLSKPYEAVILGNLNDPGSAPLLLVLKASSSGAMERIGLANLYYDQYRGKQSGWDSQKFDLGAVLRRKYRGIFRLC